MKKPILLILGLLSLSLNVLATNVSGYIGSNATWTKANSPYVITGDIDVDTGATLTIEPGVTIIADGNHVLYVDGRINAIGTASDTITFTCKQVPKDVYSATWKGIEVRHASFSDTLFFEYCHFQYAANALFVRANPVVVSNCKFDNNGTAFKNLDFPESYAWVEKCRFQHNSYGLFIAGRYVTVLNNVISDADYGFYGKGDVAYNVVYNCAYGIAYGVKVHHNTVFNCNEGLSTGVDSVSYNQLWYNKIGLTYNGNVIVTHNGINYSETGIICAGFSNGNTIKNNCIENSSKFNYVNGRSYADISNNYWGTTDSLAIDAKVFDFFDDFTSGKTRFMPVLPNEDQGCADTLNVTDTTIITTGIAHAKALEKLTIYPNPVSSIIYISVDDNQLIRDIAVFDILGNKIEQVHVDGSKASIDVSKWPGGLYLARVQLSNDVILSKIQKE
ncbi:MAG: T9SS type A sorting domain-containing protein [Bacteroidetes bacterium]|nr:T9SS type A sorting domain-containing protein [Bacteroidota bacterium]